MLVSTRSNQCSRVDMEEALQTSSMKACLRMITEIFLWLWQEGQRLHDVGSRGIHDLSMEESTALHAARVS
uniref:Uncharacterized protein n=1 Tax=Arundo donax TaxID=35708 RepID=A0A0A9G104_ARUDO